MKFKYDDDDNYRYCDEDSDFCLECGETIFRASKIDGVCQDCMDDMGDVEVRFSAVS